MKLLRMVSLIRKTSIEAPPVKVAVGTRSWPEGVDGGVGWPEGMDDKTDRDRD